MLNFIIECLVDIIVEIFFSRKYWWITCLVLLGVGLMILCWYHRS